MHLGVLCHCVIVVSCVSHIGHIEHIVGVKVVVVGHVDHMDCISGHGGIVGGWVIIHIIQLENKINSQLVNISLETNKKDLPAMCLGQNCGGGR